MEGKIAIREIRFNSMPTDHYDSCISLEIEGEGMYDGQKQTFGHVNFEIVMSDDSENHKIYNAIRMGKPLTATLNIEIKE